MTMWRLKSCPRCGGDAFVSKDQYGWYEQCLQCSHRGELKELAEFENESDPVLESK